MENKPLSSDGKPNQRAAPVYFCPECNSIVERIARNPIDKFVGLIFWKSEFGRFECNGCFWQGRMKIGRRVS